MQRLVYPTEEPAHLQVQEVFNKIKYKIINTMDNIENRLKIISARQIPMTLLNQPHIQKVVADYKRDYNWQEKTFYIKAIHAILNHYEVLDYKRSK